MQFFENDKPMLHIEAAPGTNGVVAIDDLGDRAFRTNVNVSKCSWRDLCWISCEPSWTPPHRNGRDATTT